MYEEQTIKIISIFKEDNLFSMTANLPYSSPLNTDNDYYRTFIVDFFLSDAMLVVRHFLREEKPVLSTKQVATCTIFNAFGMA